MNICEIFMFCLLFEKKVYKGLSNLLLKMPIKNTIQKCHQNSNPKAPAKKHKKVTHTKSETKIPTTNLQHIVPSKKATNKQHTK